VNTKEIALVSVFSAVWVATQIQLGPIISQDLLFFILGVTNFDGKTRKAYLLTISRISGVLANVPYVLFKLFTLLLPAFIIWIPTYVSFAVKDVVLNVPGTFIGLSILPLIRHWRTRIRV